jgi:hypothetical protein
VLSVEKEQEVDEREGEGGEVVTMRVGRNGRKGAGGRSTKTGDA